MNLADIRKKAEEKRRSVSAASLSSAAETDQMTETYIPAQSVIEEFASNRFEMPDDDPADENCIYDTQAMEHYSSVPEPAICNVEHLSDPLPPLEKVTKPVESYSPDPEVTVKTAKKQAVYNPLETILSGRDSVSESDDSSFQMHAYGSEAVEEYLCFRVAHEEYAISIMAIKEIVKPRDVTEVPRMPAFISGVISLRGVIIPVMDMRLRLSLPVTAAVGRERIVVLRMDSGFCGVLVDEVIQVARIKKSDIEEPPAVLDGIDRDFVTGLGHFDNRMLILLNLDAILDIGVH